MDLLNETKQNLNFYKKLETYEESTIKSRLTEKNNYLSKLKKMTKQHHEKNRRYLFRLNKIKNIN